MPEKMLKQCKAPGCPGLTLQGKYCDKHSHLEERDKQERMRYYNKNVRTEESQSFYESPAWRKLRQLKLKTMPLCEMCYAKGRMERAVIVDHKIEIKDGGAALDIENLTSICMACHNKKTARERAKRNNGERVIMNKDNKKLPDFLIPPTSITNTDLKIFSEQFVRMHGRDYYLRVFTDGSGEFTRFDIDSGKWVHLIFPTA